jgi:voltage-gated potassium channel
VDERSERWERRFDWVLLTAAVLVIPVVAIEESRTGESLRRIAGVTNWVIWLVFLIEFVVMLAIVSSRGRWLREHPLDVAIVVLTPPFLPAGLQTLRVFRLLRLLRLIRIVQAARRLFSPDGLRWAAILALLTVFCGGAGFAAVEKGSNEHVHNTWDGIWWALTTMTTVGYGDISPATNSGRAIAIVVMIVGIGFLTLLIGAAAERFVSMEVGPIAEAEETLATTEAEMLREVGEIRDRLGRLEASIRQLQQG